MIAAVAADVLHDVAIAHPLGYHRELPIVKCIRDPNEIENVGVRQILPHDNLFAEALRRV